jgi:hypothetical protein
MLLMSTSQLRAQDSMELTRKSPFDYEQIFSTNYWNFFIRPGIIPTTNAHFSNPAVQFWQMPAPTVSFGWLYQVNFKQAWLKRSNDLKITPNNFNAEKFSRWGIQTGVFMSLYWNYFNYSVPASYSGVGMNFGAPQKLKDEEIYSIPIYGVYKLPINDKSNSLIADFKWGVDLNIQGGDGYFEYSDIIGEPNGQNNKTVFDFKQFYPNKLILFYPSFHASVGINYVLPNKKMLNFQVVANYSPFYKEQGDFTFMPGTPQEIDGTCTRRLNNIGIELNYIFTRVRHMKKTRPGYRVPPLLKL